MRIPKLAPSTYTIFKSRRFDIVVRAKYTLTARVLLVKELRLFNETEEEASGQKFGAPGIEHVIEDLFIRYYDAREKIVDGLEKHVFADRLDVQTIRELLTCDLRVGLRRRHAGTFRVVDALLQIVEHDRPDYLSS